MITGRASIHYRRGKRFAVSNVAMRLWTILSLVPLLLAAVSAFAQPANILVDQYTFTRPKQWRWKPPGESGATNRFMVSATSTKGRTDVQFFLLSKSEPDFRARIRGNFDNTTYEKERSVTIGSTTLTYFTAIGTAVARETREKRHDFQFTGTVLPASDPDQVVFIRIAGPRDQVEPAVDDFCVMVERAVIERQ